MHSRLGKLSLPSVSIRLICQFMEDRHLGGNIRERNPLRHPLVSLCYIPPCGSTGRPLVNMKDSDGGEEQVTLTETTLDAAMKAENGAPGIGDCDSELLVPRRKLRIER